MKLRFGSIFTVIFMISWSLADDRTIYERNQKFEEIFENVKSQTLVSDATIKWGGRTTNKRAPK